MQESLNQTADAGESPSDRGFSSLLQTADAGAPLSADAGVTLSESGCMRLSIRLQMQETLY